jgi:DNA-binding XRE family transcriptional regulator
MPPTKATLPIEESPVRALRGDYTQAQFANIVGITRMALLRFEQACIPEPSLKLQPFIPEGLPWEAFVEDYHAYQVTKRQSNYGVLTTEHDFSPGARAEAHLHPLQEWINASKSTSLTQVCVALCIHLPTMYRFLNGPHPSLPPESLLEALQDSGYESAIITDFMLAYAEWRSRYGSH